MITAEEGARVLHIATAPRQNSLHWTQRTTTWGEVLLWLVSPSDKKEAGDYLLGLLKPSVVNHSEKGPECGPRLHRRKDAVVSRSALTLDVDYPDADFIERFQSWLPEGSSAVVHTTFSSRPGTPRYRLLLPVARDLAPDEYVRAARQVVRELGEEFFDPSTCQAERYMFMPSAQQQDWFQYWVFGEGHFMDPEPLLQRFEPDPTEKAPRQPEKAALPVSEDYVRQTVAGVISDLDYLGSLREGETNQRGKGWYLGVYPAGCQLVRASNSGTDYTLEQAETDFFEYAPTDPEFTRAKLEDAWTSALRDVGDEPLRPKVSAEDEFDERVDVDEATASSPSRDVFDREVAREVHRLQVSQAARARLERERRGPQPLAAPINLSDFLAEPDEDTAYRVGGLWPKDGRVVLSAQNKAGKTTLMGNLMRSLADGEQFLDRYAVQRASRVVLVDDEMSPGTIRRWLREQAIRNTRAIEVVTLRGRLSTFNLLDPVIRSEWATVLGAADVLIFDCLRPVLDALGLSEDKEAGRFLESLDEFINEAGIGELVVVHHMGHSNERSRGDSRILDWPDAVWKLVREDPDDTTSERFFSAYGRDVEQPEVRLAFNHDNRHLSVNGGSRRDVQSHRFEGDVLAFVRSNPGCSQTAIERAVTGDRMTLRRAIRQLKDTGDLRIDTDGRANHHFVVGVTAEPQEPGQSNEPR